MGTDAKFLSRPFTKDECKSTYALLESSLECQTEFGLVDPSSLGAEVESAQENVVVDSSIGQSATATIATIVVNCTAACKVILRVHGVASYSTSYWPELQVEKDGGNVYTRRSDSTNKFKMDTLEWWEYSRTDDVAASGSVTYTVKVKNYKSTASISFEFLSWSADAVKVG